MRIYTLGLCLTGLIYNHSSYANFIDDAKVEINFKNSYMSLNSDTAKAERPIANEWGQAIILNAQSGWYNLGELQLGLDVSAMTGLHLYDNSGPVYNNMFPRDGEGYTDHWGRLAGTLKAKYGENELEIGELNPKLPVISSNNGRLLPQSFLGAQFSTSPIDDLDFHLGYITKAIGRASSNWTDLSIASATYKQKKITLSKESDQFIYSGFDWQASQDLKSQYYFAQLEDFYNQHFIGLQHKQKFSKNNILSTDARYFRTTADGLNKQGVTGYGDKIDNTTYSVDFKWKLKNNQLRLAYQDVSKGSDFIQLNQTNVRNDQGVSEGAGGYDVYIPTSRWLEKFFNAGEESIVFGYQYDFKDIVKGLKFNWTYVQGKNYGECGCSKEWESDIGLDYKVPSGPLKNVLFQVQNATYRESQGPSKDQLRLNLLYTLSF